MGRFGEGEKKKKILERPLVIAQTFSPRVVPFVYSEWRGGGGN